ncbi:Phosphotransferase enzyme family protein [Amphibacillus marinus]|uniref:Phosphotransferase enzyme family protein n=1 Tax=Amphibacillus marinus TaxID=872970 RepID=A0A1H8TNP7_9BACI|nr:aminoglycoside phosphotransferase family protein [Amphibacillus marinus]SEO92592.1 Phosphotransferase enzyme family protein [Amphibacillus marinus]
MDKCNDVYIKRETLEYVLSRLLGKTICCADYQTRQLQGGTLGDVRLVTGIAETFDGVQLPYKVVWKKQKKWDRHGDPDSWRREYDLYTSDFANTLTNSFCWPVCYHAELIDDEIQLWLEYIDGVSGLNMTAEMYAGAAKELGRFQGKLYTEQPKVLQELANLSKLEYAKNVYQHYRSWNVVYDYVRSADCEIPKHLCQMLIDVDNSADEIFSRIEKLPIVLCHRDFWVANIFYSASKIVVIDWDTAGWGYLGEDIASLIADEADVGHMIEYYQKCVSAYYKGFSEYVEVSHISDHCVHELILIMFGYRLVEWFKFASSTEDKALHLNTLQKIYEINHF